MRWDGHPARWQEIAFAEGGEHVWDECQVPLNACVIRDWNKDCSRVHRPSVNRFEATTRAKSCGIGELRPEIEQDYEQFKSGGWLWQKLTTTRYSQIVFYLLMVVLAYSLYQLFTNTRAGAKARWP